MWCNIQYTRVKVYCFIHIHLFSKHFKQQRNMKHWGYNGNKAFYLPSKLLEFELHLLRQKKKNYENMSKSISRKISYKNSSPSNL